MLKKNIRNISFYKAYQEPWVNYVVMVKRCLGPF